MLTSRLPVTKCQARIGDPTVVDRILDRLVHAAHRIEHARRPAAEEPTPSAGARKERKAISMTKKLPQDITEFFRQTRRMSGNSGGKRSLQTMTAEERSERAKKAAVASAEAQRKGARQRLPAVGPTLVASRNPTPRSHALILANEILNRLTGYARKGSRARNNFYQRDLNWITDVLMRVEAGERDPLRPTGQ